MVYDKWYMNSCNMLNCQYLEPRNEFDVDGLANSAEAYDEECYLPLMSDPIPYPRSGHRIVSDDSNVYVVGGYNARLWDVPNTLHTNYPLFNEVWKFNLSASLWDRVNTTGPMPTTLASHSASLISGRQLLLFGGTAVPFGATRSNEIHICDLKLLKWHKVDCTGDVPPPNYGQSMKVHGHYVYVFGGTTGLDYSNELHRLNLDTHIWEDIGQSGSRDVKCRTNEPMARYRAEISCNGEKVFIFGGGTSEIACEFKQMNAFDITHRLWLSFESKAHISISRVGQQVSVYPSGRRYHSCVQWKDDVYMCGGQNNSRMYKDIWRFNMSTLQWTRFSFDIPRELYFHAATISPAGRMLVHGGVVHMSHFKRTTKLYSMWLTVPSLQELSWLVLCDSVPDIDTIDRTRLSELGVPLTFVQRLPSALPG